MKHLLRHRKRLYRCWRPRDLLPPVLPAFAHRCSLTVAPAVLPYVRLLWESVCRAGSYLVQEQPPHGSWPRQDTWGDAHEFLVLRGPKAPADLFCSCQKKGFILCLLGFVQLSLSHEGPRVIACLCNATLLMAMEGHMIPRMTPSAPVKPGFLVVELLNLFL